jgi:hypothetical protein
LALELELELVVPVDVKDAWVSGSIVTTGELKTGPTDDAAPLASGVPLTVAFTGGATTDVADELEVLAGVFN